MATMKTRLSGPLLDPDIDFPPLKNFSNARKLPIYADVIGVLRYLLEDKTTNISHNQAVNEVKKQLYSKWYHDSVYCITQSAILKRVVKDWAVFKEGKRRLREGRTSGKAVEEYKVLREKAKTLYDIAATTLDRIQQCVVEFGVKMSPMEHEYLQDQRSDRKMECDKGVDPVWYAAMMRRQRLRELSEKYKAEMENRFRFVDIEKISDILDEQGATSQDIPCGSGESENVDTIDSSISEHLSDVTIPTSTGQKRKRYTSNVDPEDMDPLPPEMRHVRISERIVRDDIYEALADLKGLGLSINEACKALVKVANKLFSRQWKLQDENDSIFDSDTLPHGRNLRHAEELIEAKGLACVTEHIFESAHEGRMITHATDSTTKKGVGQFAVAGIHIGQNVPFALPLIPAVGETTPDIANQCALMFEILGAVSEKSPSEIYKLVNAHMTDSTQHNKGFAEILADIFNLDSAAGQLFCGTHTTLGFASGMNRQIALVERDMTLEAIFKNFMVDLDFESKHGSVAGQALDCMLRFVAPEFQHKPWNYYKQFILHLQNNGVHQVLFSYKDQRFGCLSRAAAVMVFLFPFMESFLDHNPGITNRLSCIVRSFLNVEYLKPVFVLFGALGIHLVEPFYSVTISKETTHSELKIFYQALFDQMSKDVSSDFFQFEKPWFDCVRPNLFDGVSDSYGQHVISALTEMAVQYEEDCVKLCNFIMPELKTILGRQRRDYGISAEFEPQYPVEKQVANIDDTPVTNIAMERLCGQVDYRVHKLKQLESVSRSIILQQTEALRDQSQLSFRNFGEEACHVKDIKLTWSQSMKEKFEAGATEKQALTMTKERKRLDLMAQLKEIGGPFTSAEEVDRYMESDTVEAKKQKRMKMEVQFARESSTYLPKSDPLFRIQVTLPKKKRRDKTALEISIALKALLGQQAASQSAVTMEQFRASLRNTLGC